MVARTGGSYFGVLLGDPGRHYLPQTGLELLAEHQVPTTRDLEGVAVRRVRVFALQPEREQPGPGAPCTLA